jgi:hypothetical protein
MRSNKISGWDRRDFFQAAAAAGLAAWDIRFVEPQNQESRNVSK